MALIKPCFYFDKVLATIDIDHRCDMLYYLCNIKTMSGRMWPAYSHYSGGIMATKKYPVDTLDQAAAIIAACKQIDSTMKPGMLTQAEFADAVAQAHAIQAQI